MERLLLALSGQTVEVRCPSGVAEPLRQILKVDEKLSRAAAHHVAVEPEPDAKTYRVSDTLGTLRGGLQYSDILHAILNAATRIHAKFVSDALALNASAVCRNGTTIVIADADQAGRIQLTAWLVDRGYAFQGSDLLVMTESGRQFEATRRAFILSSEEAALVSDLDAFRDIIPIECGSSQTWQPAMQPAEPCQETVCGLIIFPIFDPGADPRISLLDTTESSLALIRNIRNSQNLADGGFRTASLLTEIAPALTIRFGSLGQLQGHLGPIVDFVANADFDARAFKKFVSTLAQSFAGNGKERSFKNLPKPSATPRHGRQKPVTIGMATYDDYDGVYFTLQSLRLHHHEAVGDSEFIIVDSNPSGPAASVLKKLENLVPAFRYIPFEESTGTAASRDLIFNEASGDFVVVMDCHVLLVPGALHRLCSYFRENPDSGDLLHGPLLQDDLDSVFTHFDPVWNKGMYGQWGADARGRDPDAPPFEIPMHGLGLFACRRAAWPGFNDRFRGFGGEEGYIHEKIRKCGGRTLCLPFLRWLHRFQRPLGVPYPIIWEDRIRNYLIGFTELGLQTEPIVEHFSELVGERETQSVLESVRAELQGPGKGVQSSPRHE